MNRLIIIGNGFDLAHGLPTGYCDFINDYWKGFFNSCEKTNQNLYTDNFVELYLEFRWEDINPFEKTFGGVENYKELVDFIESYNKTYYPFTDRKECVLTFKNDFFKTICEMHSIQNWVDVENEYYIQLKAIVKSNEVLRIKKSKAQQLNAEFEGVKFLLEKYIKEKVIDKYYFDEHSSPKEDLFKFSEIISPKIFMPMSNELMMFLNEFPEPHQRKLEDLFTHKKDIADYDCQVTILNFNYTPTTNIYIEILTSLKISLQSIYIHGRVGDQENSINFGFGDEMDDDYKIIENIDDNEYLRNFKSFQYLNTSNYKRLLDLIDSDIFQVYVMGHSCGLSDRTLLNTIFEHPNCISIKMFYHQKEDGTDNYTEITQNISRHFNKKKLMREKIVNKTLCQPLPQIELQKKPNT